MTTRLISCAVLATVTLAAVASAGTLAAPLDLLGPPHKATFTSPDPRQSVVTLSWQAWPGTAAYRIVVSAREESRPRVRRTVTEPFAVVRGLPEGTYSWRVEALDRTGAALEHSRTSSFTVRVGTP